MNRPISYPFPSERAGRDALEARYGLRVAAVLDQQAQALPHDIGERLRFARERALERARAHAPQAAISATPAGRGTLALGGDEGGWGWRLVSALPVIALVLGLIVIQSLHDDEQVRAAAEVDAALLADNLPPSAYADAGFAEFLRSRDGGN